VPACLIGRFDDVVLLGRDREWWVLDRLLAGARSGRGGCLVLRGAAGIGKTALVEHAVAGAEGFRVAAVAGVEAESELGYARPSPSSATPHCTACCAPTSTVSTGGPGPSATGWVPSSA
jgi:hypothetical protein